MTGRSDRLKRPAIAGDPLAIGEHVIGKIIAIEGSVGARTAIIKRERRAADDRGAGYLLQGTRCRTVIAMGMRANQRLHPGATKRLEDSIDVLLQIGARIYHRHARAITDQISLRSPISEGRRIIGKHPSDQRMQRLDPVGSVFSHNRDVASQTPDVKAVGSFYSCERG